MSTQLILHEESKTILFNADHIIRMYFVFRISPEDITEESVLKIETAILSKKAKILWESVLSSVRQQKLIPYDEDGNCVEKVWLIMEDIHNTEHKVLLYGNIYWACKQIIQKGSVHERYDLFLTIRESSRYQDIGEKNE